MVIYNKRLSITNALKDFNHDISISLGNIANIPIMKDGYPIGIVLCDGVIFDYSTGNMSIDSQLFYSDDDIAVKSLELYRKDYGCYSVASVIVEDVIYDYGAKDR